MIRKLRERSELTILLTTHYMEEADKLCDRIAIVDHGKLAALDTPTRLKDSIPGLDTVEAEFEKAPNDWISQLRTLAHVTGVTQREDVVHITSSDGPATIAALMDLTRSKGRRSEKSFRAEHHARRRIRPLHRERFAGRVEYRSTL